MKISRRDFVIGAGVAAAAGLAAAKWLQESGILGGAPLGFYALSGESGKAHQQAVMRSLIRAILPLEDPRFPRISVDRIESRLNALFHRDNNERFRKTLALFDRIDLFSQISDGPLTLAARARESQLYAEFARSVLPSTMRFTALELDAQRSYLRLWIRSAVELKRRFYQSIKTVVMVATYSLDETWRAIDYAGPLLKRKASSQST